jgi:predicted O-methyltransferase YrrM
MKIFVTKVTNHIRHPIKFFYKIRNIYYYFRFKLNYNETFYINNQNKIFKSLKINRHLGIKKLNNIKSNHFTYSPMNSEHQVFFASLSLKKKIKNILEIGTFDGTNSLQLSILFPKAKIKTIDLPAKSEEFKKSYDRSEITKRRQFLKKRNLILKKSNNIKFVEQNSLNLIFEKKTYDLIWVDGAHANPVVTSDIINSLRLLSKKGIMACDDVYTQKSTEDINFNSFDPKFAQQMFSNLNTYETLLSLEAAKLVKFRLIYKRIDANNRISGRRKFIAIVKHY